MIPSTYLAHDSGGYDMFSLFACAPTDDRGGEESSNYEWAEYNLPAPPDLDVLREQIRQRAERGVLT